MKMYRGFVPILILCFCSIIWAQTNYSVLFQESPPGAGEIKPGTGVHTYAPSETVPLNTVPKKGYKFVTWLGDVRNPAENRTQLTVDGPKIVIAVFERDEYEFSAEGPQITQGPPALYPNSVSYTTDGGTWDPPIHYHDDPPDNPHYDPPPVPTPEPATIVMVGIGAWLAAKHRKKE